MIGEPAGGETSPFAEEVATKDEPNFSRDFVKVPRSFVHSAMIKDPVACRVYLVCLSRARFTPGNELGGHGVIGLAVGQCVVGRDELARELRTTETRIRTGLKRLEATGYITVKSTKRGSIVTMCGYAETHHLKGVASPSGSPSNTHLTADLSPTDDRGSTTNKKEKKEKKGKSEKKEKVKGSNGGAADAAFHREQQAGIEAYDERFAAFHDGIRPYWDDYSKRIVANLIVRGGAAELKRRAQIMFERAPKYPAGDGGSLSTLKAHWDTFATRVPEQKSVYQVLDEAAADHIRDRESLSVETCRLVG